MRGQQAYTLAVHASRESRLKKVGKIGLGALVPIGFIALLFVFVLMVRGIVWAADKAFPWLEFASAIAIVVCVFVLLPLCIFRKTRPWAGVAFVYVSYLFGVMLWAYSCLYIAEVWGYVAMGLGLLFAGVGVVPMAFVAALFRGEWAAFLSVVFGIVLTFGTRFLGIRLSIIPTPQREETLPTYYDALN